MYDPRSAYLTDSVATVGPARLLTMLYDRLLLDLDRSLQSLAVGDRLASSQHLGHAQDIVGELISSLDVDAWDGGPRLLSIYTFLLTQLISAGTSGDVRVVTACRELVVPLAEAWHGAAASLADAEAKAEVSAFSQGSDERGSSVLGVA